MAEHDHVRLLFCRKAKEVKLGIDPDSEDEEEEAPDAEEDAEEQDGDAETEEEDADDAEAEQAEQAEQAAQAEVPPSPLPGIVARAAAPGVGGGSAPRGGVATKLMF